MGISILEKVNLLFFKMVNDAEGVLIKSHYNKNWKWDELDLVNFFDENDWFGIDFSDNKISHHFNGIKYQIEVSSVSKVEVFLGDNQKRFDVSYLIIESNDVKLKMYIRFGVYPFWLEVFKLILPKNIKYKYR
jgi:hypothetical protein